MAGYPDWRRVQDWDGPALYADSNLIVGTGILTDIFDVSRFGYLGGFDSAVAGDITASITWFTDPLGASFAGNRLVRLSSGLGIGAQYRLPNLGPYVRIRWDQLSAAQARHSSQIFPTNRFHPLEFIPQHPDLVPFQSGSVAASGSAVIWPSDYYAGPIHITTGMGVNWQVGLQVLDSTGNWRQGDTFTSAAGNAIQTVIAPPGAWRLSVFNSTGATSTYFVGVQHSTTGST